MVLGSGDRVAGAATGPGGEQVYAVALPEVLAQGSWDVYRCAAGARR
jgi:hypothetical protein